MNISMLRHCSPKELTRYLRDEDSEIVRLLCDRIELILEDYIDPSEFVCEDCSINESAADEARSEIDDLDSQIQRADDIADDLKEAIKAKDWEPDRIRI